MKSGEITYQKVYVSPRPPPTISYKDNQKSLQAAKTPNESNQNQKNIKKGETRGWATVHPGDRKRCLVWSGRHQKLIKNGETCGWTKSIQSCVPVSVELVDTYEDNDENVDADQTRTGRPLSGQHFTQLEEIDIDFRVPGLSHAVVKEAEYFRVQELVKKIESHPHREARQADLQKNNVYNPFSNNSKEMVREMGNVELFELCETWPKV